MRPPRRVMRQPALRHLRRVSLRPGPPERWQSPAAEVFPTSCPMSFPPTPLGYAGKSAVSAGDPAACHLLGVAIEDSASRSSAETFPMRLRVTSRQSPAASSAGCSLDQDEVHLAMRILAFA